MGDRSAGDETPSPREPAGTMKTMRAAAQVASGTLLSAQQSPMNFTMADPMTKFTLVKDLVKS